MLPFTYNADRKPALRPNGQVTTRFYSGWINYLSRRGWKGIDTTPLEQGRSFFISDAPYSLELPKLANQWVTIGSTNRFSVKHRSLITDAPVWLHKRYPTAEPVLGIPVRDGVLFRGAFPGLNADRFVRIKRDKVEDLVVFRSRPKGSADVRVPLEISTDGLLPIAGLVHDRADVLDFKNPICIRSSLSFVQSEARGVQIKKPRVWDSAGRSAPITIRLQKVGSRLMGHKIIPRWFLNSAIYPVFADSTSNFFPDAHPESATVDGFVGRGVVSEDWSTIRSGAGNDIQDSYTQINIIVDPWETTDEWDYMSRGFFLVDTSPLVLSVSLTSSKIVAYTELIEDGLGDSFSLTSCTPASNTGLTTSDYGNVGTTDWSDPKTLASFNLNANNDIPLNATGLSNINQSGITKIGMRMTSDLTDTMPTWISYPVLNQIRFSSSDQSSNHPYLEVVHVEVANHLLFEAGPTNTVAGEIINAGNIELSARYPSGGLATDFTGEVTIAIDNNPSSGTLGGDTANNVSSGLVQFTDLEIDNIGVGYTLAASATGLTGVTSDPFDISASGYTITANGGAFTLIGRTATFRRTYRISASVGTFVLTGRAAGVRAARKIIGGTGSFSLSGQAVVLSQGYGIVALTGVFNEAGQLAQILATRRITAGTGSYSLSGQAVDFRKTFPVYANTGVFVLSGVAAELTKSGTHTVDAGTGSFVVGGQAVTFHRTFAVKAVAGSFNNSGKPAALIYGHPLIAGTGSFVVGGQAVGMRATRLLAVDCGTYTVTGGAASLEIGFRLIAAAGSYAESGQAASLYRGFGIDAGKGTFTLAGIAARVLFKRKMAAASGSYLVSGQVAGLRAGRFVVCAAGTFAETGQAASLFIGRAIDAEAGIFIEAGIAVGLTATRTMPAAVGVFVETGNPVTLLATHNPLVAETGSFTESGIAAAMKATRIIVSSPGAFTLTGFDTDPSAGRFLRAVAGSFLLTGQPTTYIANRVLTAVVGEYELIGDEMGLVLVNGLARMRFGRVVLAPRLKASIDSEHRITGRVMVSPRIKGSLEFV